MPLLRLNIVDGHIHCPETDAAPLRDQIARRLAGLGRHDPIVILLHGYRYTPQCRYRNAHKLIFAAQHMNDGPRRFGVSWPSALGYGPGGAAPGLCIPVSWEADGALRDVYLRAEDVGRRVAELLGLLAALDPRRPVHLMAHSLGARVALTAVVHTRSRAVRRLILLAPAEFESPAMQALRSRAAAAMEVLQVSPAENRFFDLMLSRGLGPARWAGPTLGRADIPAPCWSRLRIDTPEELAQLKWRGFAVGARSARICHWSAYLRPGLMELYSACLAGPNAPSFVSLTRRRRDPARPNVLRLRQILT